MLCFPRGWITLRSGSIKSKFIFPFLLIASGGVAFYYLLYLPARRRPAEVAYVLPPVLAVVDTTAEVRMVVETLKDGDRVEVLGRTPNWAHVRLADGRSGWVETKNLLDSETYEGGKRLLKELGAIPPQAVGHTTNVANLHLQPSRDAPQLAQLPERQSVEIIGRRLVDRPAAPDQPAPGVTPRDAWYLIRSDSRAGWIMGRLVALDVPEGISMYAQGVNLVAWLVVNTLDDEGRQVPQYLVADRVGTQDFDFNHLRVFTWWGKKRQYATAYVESNLRGFFPIRITRLNNLPYFRLRLVDRNGGKFQKVYGMFGSIVRPLGTVDGWESEAMPARPITKFRRSRRAAGRSRRGR